MRNLRNLIAIVGLMLLNVFVTSCTKEVEVEKIVYRDRIVEDVTKIAALENEIKIISSQLSDANANNEDLQYELDVAKELASSFENESDERLNRLNNLSYLIEVRLGNESHMEIEVNGITFYFVNRQTNYIPYSVIYDVYTDATGWDNRENALFHAELRMISNGSLSTVKFYDTPEFDLLPPTHYFWATGWGGIDEYSFDANDVWFFGIWNDNVKSAAYKLYLVDQINSSVWGMTYNQHRSNIQNGNEDLTLGPLDLTYRGNWGPYETWSKYDNAYIIGYWIPVDGINNAGRGIVDGDVIFDFVYEDGNLVAVWSWTHNDNGTGLQIHVDDFESLADFYSYIIDFLNDTYN